MAVDPEAGPQYTSTLVNCGRFISQVNTRVITPYAKRQEAGGYN